MGRFGVLCLMVFVVLGRLVSALDLVDCVFVWVLVGFGVV